MNGPGPDVAPPTKGWAVKLNGEINPRTVGDSKRMAQVNAFWMFGLNCPQVDDETINHLFESLKTGYPTLDVVEVKIEEDW